MYRIASCVLLIVGCVYSTDYSNHTFSLSDSDWALVDDFGLGLGETGKVNIIITNSEYDFSDHILTVTLTGPTGFRFDVVENPASGGGWDSERHTIGTTADAAASVAGTVIEGAITDMILEAAVHAAGYTIPYYNVYQAVQTLETAHSICQTLESGIEYDIITHVFEKSASGMYEFTIDNPMIHPYSNNTITIMILPVDAPNHSVRFSQSGGILIDNEMGLEWRVGPDREIDWYEAENWISDLGGNWRMPSVSELNMLGRRENRDELAVLRGFLGLYWNSGILVWSSERDSPYWDVDFAGAAGMWIDQGMPDYGCAFAVRSL